MEIWLTVVLGVLVVLAAVWFWRRYNVNGAYKLDGGMSNAVIITDVSGVDGSMHKVLYVSHKDFISEADAKKLSGPVNFETFKFTPGKLLDQDRPSVYSFTDKFCFVGWYLKDHSNLAAGLAHLKFHMLDGDLTMEAVEGQPVKLIRVDSV